MGESRRLREQALRCIRLSLDITDTKMIAALTALATESNDAAANMEAAQMAMIQAANPLPTA
jgi:hypothetical protein